MPRPIAVPVRRSILEQYSAGVPVPQIATALGMNPRTVRNLVQRFRHHGEQGLAPLYRTGPRKRPPLREHIRQVAEHLRREHPTWGAEVIRVMLPTKVGLEHIPTARTLQRWFRESGLAGAQPGRRCVAVTSCRAQQPHDVWQVDASEDILLKTGQRVSWLRVVDEHTGAVLATRVFPLGTMEPRRRRRGAGVPARRI